VTLQIEHSRAGCQADEFAPDPRHPFIPSEFQRLAANRLLTRRSSTRRNPKITHLIGALGGGGAERQLVNLVTALAARNFDVSVLTLEPLEGPCAFRLPALQASAVPAYAIDRISDPASSLKSLPHIEALIARLPNWLKPWPFQIAQTLAADPPDLLHIWLDFTNITGAIAALLLGIPHVILSTRSVNPTHFSYMNTPWFKPWYAFLATVPDIRFLNNSEAGRTDYAAWMQVLEDRFEVIRNGIDTELYNSSRRMGGDAFRHQLGMRPDELLLTGVFRLSEEKRPFLFLEVAAQVMSSHAQLHSLILGGGPMESVLQSQIASSPFANRIHLLPPRNDMPAVYAASDLLLQTSILEGTPNTLLEAQSAGCPVVTTSGGGAGECLLNGHTGFIADTAKHLSEKVSQILDDPTLRKHFSDNGRKFVREHFAMDRMVQNYISLYSALVARS